MVEAVEAGLSYYGGQSFGLGYLVTWFSGGESIALGTEQHITAWMHREMQSTARTTTHTLCVLCIETALHATANPP